MVRPGAGPNPNGTDDPGADSGARRRRRERRAQPNPFAAGAVAPDDLPQDPGAVRPEHRRGIGPLVVLVVSVAFWASPVLWMLFGWWVLPVVFTLPWIPALVAIVLIAAFDRLCARHRAPPARCRH